MAQRIFEEASVIVKQKHTVRILEFKENGKEYTEISVYSKDVTEKNNDDFSDYFEFCFTVKGRAEEEKRKIDNMSDPEFENFVKIMTHFIEKKYHIKYKLEEKKEEKKDAVKPVENKVETLSDIAWDTSDGDTAELQEIQEDPDIQK